MSCHKSGDPSQLLVTALFININAQCLSRTFANGQVVWWPDLSAIIHPDRSLQQTLNREDKPVFVVRRHRFSNGD